MVRKAAKSLVERARAKAGKRAEEVSATIEDAMGAVNSTIDSAIKRTEELRNALEKSAEDTADQTTRRAAKLALSVVDFQKTTFDNTFKVLSQIQTSSEKAVSSMISDASWMPKEGKQVVKEWERVLASGRSEFQKTVDKSFDLITSMLERVHEGAAPKKKSAAKKKAAPKKKAAAKKPAAKKAVAKKAPAKKKAVAKKAPAKKKAAAKKSAA